MAKRTEPRERTEPMEFWIPVSAKITLGIQAAKLETSLSGVVRAVLNKSIDPAAQFLYLPALGNEDLVKVRVRVNKTTKRTLEFLSDCFGVPVHPIARGALINYCNSVKGANDD